MQNNKNNQQGKQKQKKTTKKTNPPVVVEVQRAQEHHPYDGAVYAKFYTRHGLMDGEPAVFSHADVYLPAEIQEEFARTLRSVMAACQENKATFERSSEFVHALETLSHWDITEGVLRINGGPDEVIRMVNIHAFDAPLFSLLFYNCLPNEHA